MVLKPDPKHFKLNNNVNSVGVKRRKCYNLFNIARIRNRQKASSPPFLTFFDPRKTEQVTACAHTLLSPNVSQCSVQLTKLVKLDEMHVLCLAQQL